MAIIVKADKKKRPEFANTTRSVGGYNIRYGNNGHVLGYERHRPGVTRAPSSHVTDFADERAKYGGSPLDQQYFTNGELAQAAQNRLAAEQGKQSWEDAHNLLEQIRSRYGYSGGADGQTYTPVYNRPPQEQDDLENGGSYYGRSGAPTYTSKYQRQIDALMDQILSRGKFSYNAADDPLFKQYKAQYTQAGQQAMDDTIGQLSARTGGLASSYAASAAAQANNQYMQQLNNKIPELQQLAYEMYLKDADMQMRDLDMLMGIENRDYGRYMDQLGQWNADRNFNYGVHRDQVGDARYDREWQYGVDRDKLADQRYDQEWQHGLDRENADDALRKAQTLAAAGDFSGYKALGYTDNEIARMQQAYNQQMVHRQSSRRVPSGRVTSKKPSADPGNTDWSAVEDYVASGGDAEDYIGAFYEQMGYSSVSQAKAAWKVYQQQNSDERTNAALNEVFGMSTFRHLLQMDPEQAKEYANRHLKDMSDEDYKEVSYFLK